jgi:hypothetical protein
MSKARDLANAGTALGAVDATELGYLDGVTSAVQTQIDAKTAKSTLTTTGDIIYASSANTPARLGIGSTDQILKVSGGVPTWATPSAGGWTLISEVSPSNASSVDFTSIAGTYKHLVLEWMAIYHTAADTGFNIRLNSDSAANYQMMAHTDSGTNADYTAGTDITASNNQGSSLNTFGMDAIATSQPGYGCRGKLMIFNYADTAKYKHAEGNYFYYKNGTAEKRIGRFDTLYKSTSAITSINIIRTNGTAANLSTMTGGYIRLWGQS